MSVAPELRSVIIRTVEIAANCIEALGTFDPTDPRSDRDFEEALEGISRADRLLHLVRAEQQFQEVLETWKCALAYLGLWRNPDHGGLSFGGSYYCLWERTLDFPPSLLDLLRQFTQGQTAPIQGERPEPATAPSVQPAPSDLNDSERSILEAARDVPVRGRRLAAIIKHPFSSNFRATLSSLKKRGLLRNEGQGYYRPKTAPAST